MPRVNYMVENFGHFVVWRKCDQKERSRRLMVCDSIKLVADSNIDLSY